MANTVCRLSPACWQSRSARGRARADAQGRCDGAGSEENRLQPSGMATLCRRVHSPPSQLLASLSRIERILPKSIKQKAPFSLVMLPSGGLGLQNAKIARLLLPGAPIPLFGPSGRRHTAVAYTGKYPIPSTSSNDSFSAPRRPESEKPAGDYRENAGGDYCGALHSTSDWRNSRTRNGAPGWAQHCNSLELSSSFFILKCVHAIT